ncbi:MAG: cation transporter [Chromatiaceae bacterium]|nr:MAG: cation transporter [Chromatiaceae bacterium]
MVELKIEGMSCMHCVKAVTEALSAVPGVTTVRGVDLEHGTAAVDGAPEPAALVAALQAAGYQAEVGG